MSAQERLDALLKRSKLFSEFVAGKAHLKRRSRRESAQEERKERRESGRGDRGEKQRARSKRPPFGEWEWDWRRGLSDFHEIGLCLCVFVFVICVLVCPYVFSLSRCPAMQLAPARKRARAADG